MFLAKQDEAGVILTDEQNDFLFADASRMEEIRELESYKEKVRVFEMTKENNTTFFTEYVKADRKAKHFEQESQSQFIHDRDVICVGNKMYKAFPLPGESSHWQYNFPLPVEGVPTARRM
nr:hypothetical protein [Tanacetum cinerariifolium]